MKYIVFVNLYSLKNVLKLDPQMRHVDIYRIPLPYEMFHNDLLCIELKSFIQNNAQAFLIENHRIESY